MSWSEMDAWTAALSLYRNQSGDDNLDLYSIKITRDLARVFLKQTMSTASLPDFLNSSGDSNHNISSPYHHFLLFLSSIALMRGFC
jgi:hypothetical protein